MLINRDKELSKIRTALRRSRVVALLGPRQSGKTTLARQFVDPGSRNYFDLEDPSSLARLETPELALRPLEGLVVIDEVQRSPDLFPLLRVLADRSPLPTRFLILGSASPGLLRQASESLAGRLEQIEIGGLSLDEVGRDQFDQHWLRGGYPLSFLAETETDSFEWRRQLLLTVLERDIPQLGLRIPSSTLLRFWTMLAHYHGQLWNGAELARSCGVGESAVRRYLDLLTGLFLVRQLQPWHENLGKRQVKSPKIYIRDTGLLHVLLGIRSIQDLETNPKLGASWEGRVIEEILGSIPHDAAYFWGTHNGAEIDLILFQGSKRLGIECKRSDAPRLTASMRQAKSELKLDRLLVIYPGSRSYELADGITALPLNELLAVSL